MSHACFEITQNAMKNTQPRALKIINNEDKAYQEQAVPN
jgi:hypothetical protein